GHDEIDAAAPERLHKIAAQILVETPQDLFTAMDQCGFGAKAGENRGKFNGYIAAPRNNDAPWQTLEVKRLIRGNDILGALEVGIDDRAGARRDQDRACGEPRSVTQTNFSRPVEHSARFEYLNTALSEAAFIGAFKAGDLAIFVGDECWPIEGG